MASHVIGINSRDTIAAYIDGSRDNPWLLLSNSLAADSSMWDDQLPLLVQSHRVVRYDTRGHGRSSSPGGYYTLDMLVSDLVGVMDYFGITRADVMGLSLGGMTALGLALSHPLRINRLICAGARADSPPSFIQSWTARAAAVEESGISAVVAGTLQRWFSGAGRAANPRLDLHATEMILRTTRAGYIGCVAALSGLNYLHQLSALEVPVLYIAGALDTGIPLEIVRAMAAATPDAEIAILSGAAHLSNMEDPVGFGSAAQNFLVRQRDRLTKRIF
jgi:3-oxoadipate enol-lactonase